MKKVSILTFSKGDNYGAVLQAYALGEVVKGLGYEVEYISLTWTTFRYYFTSRLTPLRSIFEKFRKKYLVNFSKSCKSREDLCKAVEDSVLCIVGSDQVWNPEITGSRWPYYFFDFLPEDMPRISYAASFGTETWNHPDIAADVKRLLSKFNKVSVREDSGAAICKNLFDTEADIVADPTILLGNFDRLLQKPGHKDSIVGFMFSPSRSYYNLLDTIREKSGKKVLVMDLPSRHSTFDLFKFNISPFTSVPVWITNIANASVVVTDSFHCLAFSILFHRDFLFIANNKKLSGRAKSLTSQLGIEGRIFDNPIDAIEKYKDLAPIDYSKAEKKLCGMREKSMAFLESALAGI